MTMAARFVLGGLLLAGTGRLAAKIEPEPMLRALAAIETGNNPRAVGKKGERSAWQLMPATWRIYTRRPFREATTNEVLAQAVARAHLAATLSRLGKGGRVVMPADVARAWNPRAPRDYAQRLTNLYLLFREEAGRGR